MTYISIDNAEHALYTEKSGDEMHQYRIAKVLNGDLTIKQLFGITDSVSETELKKIYYTLSKVFHPDKNELKGAQEAFILVSTIYQRLKENPSLDLASCINDLEPINTNIAEDIFSTAMQFADVVDISNTEDKIFSGNDTEIKITLWPSGSADLAKVVSSIEGDYYVRFARLLFEDFQDIDAQINELNNLLVKINGLLSEKAIFLTKNSIEEIDTHKKSLDNQIKKLQQEFESILFPTAGNEEIAFYKRIVKQLCEDKALYIISMQADVALALFTQKKQVLVNFNKFFPKLQKQAAILCQNSNTDPNYEQQVLAAIKLVKQLEIELNKFKNAYNCNAQTIYDFYMNCRKALSEAKPILEANGYWLNLINNYHARLVSFHGERLPFNFPYTSAIREPLVFTEIDNKTSASFNLNSTSNLSVPQLQKIIGIIMLDINSNRFCPFNKAAKIKKLTALTTWMSEESNPLDEQHAQFTLALLESICKIERNPLYSIFPSAGNTHSFIKLKELLPGVNWATNRKIQIKEVNTIKTTADINTLFNEFTSPSPQFNKSKK